MSIKKKVKNYNVLIEEGLRTRQMYPTDILKVDNTDSTDSLWMPQDNANYGTLYASENGIYIAARDGYDAYSEVDVRVTFDDFSDLDIDNLDDTWDKDLDIDEFDDLFNDEDLWDDPFDKIDSSFDDRVTGIDPVSGNEYAVGLDANGYLDEYLLPSKIRIIKPPNKITYLNGEVIDYTGIVVMALTEDSKPWKNEKYPDGIIPFEELIFPIDKADASEIDNIKYATSELDTSPFVQPIPIAVKEFKSYRVDYSRYTYTTFITTYDETRYLTETETHPDIHATGTFFTSDDSIMLLIFMACDATNKNPDNDRPGFTTKGYGKRTMDKGYETEVKEYYEFPALTEDYRTEYYDYHSIEFYYEYNDKSVFFYHKYIGQAYPEPEREIFNAIPTVTNTGDLPSQNRAGYLDVLGKLAWTMIHGDIIGGVQGVPVQWKRPDGEILQDMLYLNVSYPNETVPDHDWNIIDPTIDPHDIPETPEGEVTPEVEVTP